jgi:hypothetical protein
MYNRIRGVINLESLNIVDFRNMLIYVYDFTYEVNNNFVTDKAFLISYKDVAIDTRCSSIIRSLQKLKENRSVIIQCFVVDCKDYLFAHEFYFDNMPRYYIVSLLLTKEQRNELSKSGIRIDTIKRLKEEYCKDTNPEYAIK